MPPPMSITATPISFSSSESTASALASGSSTTSATVRPQRSAQRTTFCTQDVAAVIEVDLHAEADAAHPDRIADAVLVVDDELARQHVEDLTIGVDRDGARALEHAVDVGARDLAAARSPRRRRSVWQRMWLPATPAYTVRISTPAMVCAASIASAIDAHGPVDVGDDALAQPAARHVADAEDGDPVGVDLAHDGRHLRRPDVQADDNLGGLDAALHARPTSCEGESPREARADAAMSARDLAKFCAGDFAEVESRAHRILTTTRSGCASLSRKITEALALRRATSFSTRDGLLDLVAVRRRGRGASAMASLPMVTTSDAVPLEVELLDRVALGDAGALDVLGDVEHALHREDDAGAIAARPARR